MQKNGRSRLKEFCDREDYYCSYNCVTDPQDEQKWRATVYVARDGKNVAVASCKDFFRNKGAAMDNAAEAVLVKLRTIINGKREFGPGEWKQVQTRRSKSPPRERGTGNRSRSPVPRSRGGDLLSDKMDFFDSSSGSGSPQLGPPLDLNTLKAQLQIENSILPRVPIYTNIYIIDLENRPFWNREKLRDALYIGFISSTHGAVEKYYDWQTLASPHLLQESSHLNNKLLYKAEGGVKELVDHFMSAFVVYIVDYVVLFRLPTVVHIVSGDNSGWCTRLCLAQHAKWKGVENLLKIENKT